MSRGNGCCLVWFFLGLFARPTFARPTFESPSVWVYWAMTEPFHAAAAAAVAAVASIKETLAYSAGAVTEISFYMTCMGAAAVLAGVSVSLADTDRHLLPAACAVAASGVAIASHWRAVAVATALDDVFETTVALAEHAAAAAKLASAIATATATATATSDETSLATVAGADASADADTDDEMVDASGV